MPSRRQRSLTSPPVDHLLEAHAHILGDLETHTGNDPSPQLPASPLMYRSLTSDGDREIELRDGGAQGVIDKLWTRKKKACPWLPRTVRNGGRAPCHYKVQGLMQTERLGAFFCLSIFILFYAGISCRLGQPRFSSSSRERRNNKAYSHEPCH